MIYLVMWRMGLTLVMDEGMRRWDLGFGLDMYR